MSRSAGKFPTHIGYAEWALLGPRKAPLAAFTGRVLAQEEGLSLETVGKALAELAARVNGQQAKIEVLETQLHCTYQQLHLLKMTAVGVTRRQSSRLQGTFCKWTICRPKATTTP